MMLLFCTECCRVFYGDLIKCPDCDGVNLVPLAISETIVAAEYKVLPTGCPDCGSPYVGGKLEAHFTGCPRAKKGSDIP